MLRKPAVTALLSDYQRMDRQRLELKQQADKLEQAQKAIIDELTENGVPTDTYGPYFLKVEKKKVPRCTDWGLFYGFIKANDAFDCLHKRLTETAIMARVNDAEYVPGIVTDEKITYKVSAK